MSLPSDMTADVPVSPTSTERAPTNRLNAQQVGLAAAALVAFLGITYVGPAITRLTRKPSLGKRLRQTRRDAAATGRRLGQRVGQSARDVGDSVRRGR